MTTAREMALAFSTPATLGERAKRSGNSGLHRSTGGTSRSTLLSSPRKASMRRIVLWKHTPPSDKVYVYAYTISHIFRYAADTRRRVDGTTYAGLGNVLHRAFAIRNKQVQ